MAALAFEIVTDVIDATSRAESLAVALASTNQRSRAEAVTALGLVPTPTEMEIGVLVGLASDPSLRVRTAVAAALGRQIRTGVRHPAAIASAEIALGHGGTLVPYEFFSGLAGPRAIPLPDRVVNAIRRVKADHLSSRVRRIANDFLVELT